MTQNKNTYQSGARFSEDRKYRYALWRSWDEEKGHCMFIGLNPSTADETLDDPTVRRCIGFAKRWDYGGIYMLNIFALRSTDPKVLKDHLDPIGPNNMESLKMYHSAAWKTVACWGNHGKLNGMDGIVKDALRNMWCFGLTGEYQPKHPLYLKGDSKLTLY